MRFVSFEAAGRPGFGLVEGGVIDLSKKGKFSSIKEMLEKDGIAWAKQFRSAPVDYALDAITFLPVVPDPAHVFCLALNYVDHVNEVNVAGMKRDVPAQPAVFLRAASSLTGHKQPIVKPKVSDALDFEAELAVIIGKQGRHIKAADALQYVAGYSCFNDGSVRDWQFHTRQITPGKNFHRTGALGPWMVTADEIPDPQDLQIQLTLNAQMEQDGNTSNMVYSVARFIEYVSAITLLQPGDVLATGTPSGVGWSRKPPLYMRDGDTVDVTIERIGTLSNPIVAEV